MKTTRFGGAAQRRHESQPSPEGHHELVPPLIKEPLTECRQGQEVSQLFITRQEDNVAPAQEPKHEDRPQQSPPAAHPRDRGRLRHRQSAGGVERLEGTAAEDRETERQGEGAGGEASRDGSERVAYERVLPGEHGDTEPVECNTDLLDGIEQTEGDG